MTVNSADKISKSLDFEQIHTFWNKLKDNSPNLIK